MTAAEVDTWEFGSPQMQRWGRALRVKDLKRVNLPHLDAWNYDPCAKHAKPTPLCEFRQCGGDFFDHQTLSIGWFYICKKGLDASVTGAGKAQPFDAKVLTPDGFVPMGNVAVGDTVLTPRGERSRVLGVFPQPAQAIYRVTLNDGSTTRVTAEHLWTVETGAGTVRRKFETLTTQQIMDRGLTLLGQDRLRFKMPEVDIEDEDAECVGPIEPYLLGALIGDGTFYEHAVWFTSADDEIVARLKHEAKGLRWMKVQNSNPASAATTYRIVGAEESNYLLRLLQELGLSGMKSHEKFIPESYMNADRWTRLFLLRGLMDTDGTIDRRNGGMDYSTNSARLAYQVANLARSLGGYARVAERETSWTYDGVKKTSRSYRVSLNCPSNPFWVSRKAELYRNPQKHRRIAKIELDGHEPAQCILIDHPDHLYATDDYIPTHNTNIALGTLALCRQMGERIKAVIICQTPAVLQWQAEAARFAPGLKAVTVNRVVQKTKAERLHAYASDWEVLILGSHLLTRDIDALEALRPLQVVSDDVDPILNPANATYKAMRRLADAADRALTFNATSIQTRIQQLWSATSVIGGEQVFGSLDGFEQRYIKREPVYFTITSSDGSRERKKGIRLAGVQELPDFRRKFYPMHIRHDYDSMTDVRLPDIMPAQHVWLDMYPAQRRKYELLQLGVLELINNETQTPQQKSISAMTAYGHGQQICTGLPALGEPDGPGRSIKLDWLEFCLSGEWADRKVVVFARNVGTIQALHARLSRLSIGYATIWGQKQNALQRDAEKTRFWEDPSCKVMIGSSAMERSLNLHVSNLLVFLDTIPNPARMTQLIGRIRRAGSAHERVWTFYPLVRDSQEERYMKILGSRQAIVDAVNNEDNSDLFQRLTAEELMRLISG